MEEDATVYNSQLDAFTLYHIIQEEEGSASSSTGIGPALPALGHALAGSVATAAAKAAIYPLELVITRLQVQKQLRGKGEAESAAKDADQEYSGLIDAAQKIYKTEGGLKPFYAGVTTEIGKGVADSFLFFLSYTFLRQFELKRNGGKQLPISKELGVGVLAGSFSKFFTTPIQNIVTRQQTAALVAARDPNSTKSPGEADNLSVREIARQIHAERGIAGFWAGYAETVVLTTNPAITFAVDNFLTRLLPKSRRDNTSPQVTFLIAALSKAIATLITYPATLAKSRAQAAGSSGDDEGADTGGPPEYLEKPNMDSTPQRLRVKRAVRKLGFLLKAQQNMYYSMRRIYRKEGLSGLYSGYEGEVLKGFLQHGLTMMVKERAHVVVIQLYYLLLKATRRWPSDIQNASDSAKGLAQNASHSAKGMAQNATDSAREMARGAQGSASGMASDAQERVVNVGETVSEGTKRMYEKATGQDKD